MAYTRRTPASHLLFFRANETQAMAVKVWTSQVLQGHLLGLTTIF